MRLRHAEGVDQAQHFLQFAATLLHRFRAGTERIEFVERVLQRGRAHLHEGEDPGGHFGAQTERFAGQRVAHVVGAALVQLVHLAQHQHLLLAIDDAEALEVAAHQLAVVELDGKRADRQFAEHAVDHRRDLGVVAHRQRVLADHVDIALVELAETPALRALAAVHLLHLVAAEREAEVALMLGDVARERHGEVEAQRQLGRALLGLAQRAGGLHEVHLPLGLAAGLGQQHVGVFDHRRLHRQEAETLVVAADHVEHALERDLVERQQLEHAGHGAGRGKRHGILY